MDELKGDIVQAAEALKSAELTKSLLELPVEDLNKYKKGLRTSLLRENGYTSIAHVCNTSYSNLSAIYGISESSARDMKKIAGEYAKQVQIEIRVRLSSDNRTAESTSLIRAVAAYRRADILVRDIADNAFADSDKMEYAQSDLSSVMGVRWLLSSKAKKARAEEAYSYLREAYLGSYGSIQRLTLKSSMKLATCPAKMPGGHLSRIPWAFQIRSRILRLDFLVQMVLWATGSPKT